MDCQYTRYYQEPNHKYICMSMSLFLPEKYQKITYGKQREIIEQKKNSFFKHITFNMKLIMNNYFPDNYYYRIYYDDSIQKDEKFIALIDTLKNNHKYQIIKYKCPGALNTKTDTGHINLFGTMLRFHPLFDKESPNIEAVAIMDADNIYTRHWVKNIVEFVKNDKYNLMTYQGILESPFYKSDLKNNDKIDQELNRLFFRAGMTCMKKKAFNYDIWDKYFNQMYDQQDFMNQVRYLDFKKYASFPESTEQSFYSFEYGMDEIFLNFILKKMLKEGKLKLKIHRFINEIFKKFFYKRFTDFIQYNYKHNNQLCNEFLKKLAINLKLTKNKNQNIDKNSNKNSNKKENYMKLFRNWMNKEDNLVKLLKNLNQYQNQLKKLYIQTDFIQFIADPRFLEDKDILPYDNYLTTLETAKSYVMY